MGGYQLIVDPQNEKAVDTLRKRKNRPHKPFALMAKDLNYLEKIVHLTEHFKVNKKDNHSRRGLLALVNRRKKLLKYLKSRDSKRYYDIIAALSLRDSY